MGDLRPHKIEVTEVMIFEQYLRPVLPDRHQEEDRRLPERWLRANGYRSVYHGDESWTHELRWEPEAGAGAQGLGLGHGPKT